MPAVPESLPLFVHTPTFANTAKGLLSDDDLRQLEGVLATDPDAGTLEAGTGGIRKLRIALPGRGKSGSARVVYYFRRARGRIYLLLAFPKNAKAALTAAERKKLAALVERLNTEA
jgi:hypothetical protein